LVVAKVVDNRYRYDIADTNLGIGNPMQSVDDSKVSIESLDINWQELPADGKNSTRW